VEKDGEPWFCAKDVCSLLGYGTNSRHTVTQHCKEEGVLKLHTPTSGGNQQLLYVSERNLYRLIMRSKLDSAERFQDWVEGEVLPTIRKTGKYSTDPMTALRGMVEAVKETISETALAAPAPCNIFNFEGSNIRTVVKDGEPWFVAKDVAEALGYVNTKDAIKSHCKCSEILKGRESLPFTTSPRGITIIPERDIYRLVLKSNLPSAEKFEEWVVGEVLPTIVRTWNNPQILTIVLSYLLAVNLLSSSNIASRICLTASLKHLFVCDGIARAGLLYIERLSEKEDIPEYLPIKLPSFLYASMVKSTIISSEVIGMPKNQIKSMGSVTQKAAFGLTAP